MHRVALKLEMAKIFGLFGITLTTPEFCCIRTTTKEKSLYLCRSQERCSLRKSPQNAKQPKQLNKWFEIPRASSQCWKRYENIKYSGNEFEIIGVSNLTDYPCIWLTNGNPSEHRTCTQTTHILAEVTRLALQAGMARSLFLQHMNEGTSTKV